MFSLPTCPTQALSALLMRARVLPFEQFFSIFAIFNVSSKRQVAATAAAAAAGKDY